MDTAVKIVLSICRGYRLPEPLRQAHLRVNRLRNAEQAAPPAADGKSAKES